MVTTENLHLITNSISAINFDVSILFSPKKEEVKLFWKNFEGSLLWFWQEQTLKWTNFKYHEPVKVSNFINDKNWLSVCLNPSVKSTKPIKQPLDLPLKRRETCFRLLFKTKRLTNVHQETFEISLKKSCNLKSKFVQKKGSVCLINICTEITSSLTPRSKS